MLEIVSIIVIVFGVLQIILFFKIWGMTNDVKELAGKTNGKKNIITNARKALLVGDKDKAAEILTEGLLSDLTDYANGKYNGYNGTKDILNKYKERFEKIGIDKLPIIDIKVASDIRKLME